MIPLVPPPEPSPLVQIVKEISPTTLPHLHKATKKSKLDDSTNQLQPTEMANASHRKPTQIEQSKLSHPLISYLLIQQRGGNSKKFKLSSASVNPEATTAAQVTESNSPSNTPATVEQVNVVEVIADNQVYDDQQQVITAQGNVVMRFAQAVLIADQLKVNLTSRLAVAQGDVVLKRGEQVLRGEKFEYYLVQDRGVVTNASGEVYQPTLAQDLATGLPEDETIPEQTLSDRLAVNQPLSDVTADEDISVVIGGTRDLGLVDQNSNISAGLGGQINRLRFQADQLTFEGDIWQASSLRLTNDPFSPPELEIRAEQAQFRQVEPLVNELTTTNSRVVVDQSFALPLLANRLVFDSRPRQPGIVQFGFDGEERGGFFVERTFRLMDTERFNWEITPQYYLQRAIFPNVFNLNEEEEGGLFDSSVFGVKSRLNGTISARTSVEASTTLTSLDFDNIEDELRAQVALQQRIGQLNNPHALSLEYNFRERLFNGSLGFQTVYSSIGGILTSPNIPLGKTGINLRYQGSIQNISADTDRDELLEADRDNDRINLTRYQGAASLSRGFFLWRGQPLPATQDQGLRYTPSPVVPFLRLNAGITGVSSLYSNGDTQESLRGSIGIRGQLGHFSRSTFDYTGFELTYSRGISGNESPFLFDRYVDRQSLTLGITQQLYGPIRLGFRTSVNLDNGDEISTDYVLEYSRRTHNISVRYNPVLQIGSISFRISGFNWRGDPEPFDNVEPVVQGVKR